MLDSGESRTLGAFHPADELGGLLRDRATLGDPLGRTLDERYQQGHIAFTEFGDGSHEELPVDRLSLCA
jgi:hypothetical protein